MRGGGRPHHGDGGQNSSKPTIAARASDLPRIALHRSCSWERPAVGSGRELLSTPAPPPLNYPSIDQKGLPCWNRGATPDVRCVCVLFRTPASCKSWCVVALKTQVFGAPPAISLVVGLQSVSEAVGNMWCKPVRDLRYLGQYVTWRCPFQFEDGASSCRRLWALKSCGVGDLSPHPLLFRPTCFRCFAARTQSCVERHDSIGYRSRHCDRQFVLGCVSYVFWDEVLGLRGRLWARPCASCLYRSTFIG